ncbi:MAG: hypothetical protein M5U35_02475 [Roseovarius sp.]|nr:hypothetical protein [Roseovarius sp.]
MNTDLILVTGIVLAALSVPAMISAISDSRPPRVAAFVAMAAGGLIIWAVSNRPGGYGWDDIPRAFVRVVAEFVM